MTAEILGPGDPNHVYAGVEDGAKTDYTPKDWGGKSAATACFSMNLIHC